MTKSNFNICTEWALIHEGGYVNHPKDPGGATNKGVIQRTYNGFRDLKKLARQSVRHITMDEVMEIYKSQYWDLVQGDLLPAGLDYAVYDFSINSGPSRAVRFLQEILGVKVDGVMGNATLGAVRKRNDINGLIQELCLKRWNWMKRLKTFSTFGKGWTRRVMGDIIEGVQAGRDHGVIDRAVYLFNGQNISDRVMKAPTMEAPGKAEDEDMAVFGQVKEELTLDSLGKISAGIIPGALATVTALPEGPFQYAAAGILVLAAVVVAWIVIKKFAK